MILTKRKSRPKPPPPLLDDNGDLTRHGAMAEARQRLGEMATISSYDDPALPRVVWVIGDFHATVGRGKTWEEALAHARPSKRVPMERPKPKADPVLDYHENFAKKLREDA